MTRLRKYSFNKMRILLATTHVNLLGIALAARLVGIPIERQKVSAGWGYTATWDASRQIIDWKSRSHAT